MELDWIKWNGGPQPVANDVLVAVILRDGSEGSDPAHVFRWDHENHGGDIMRYRVVEQAEQQPECVISEEWTTWAGGDCPVHPDADVMVKYRMGGEPTKHVARNLGWQHGYGGRDVVAYRVIDAKPILPLDGHDLAALRASPIARAIATESLRHPETKETAGTLLSRAKQIMDERAITYDQPGGERSMGKTVEMFNIATGRNSGDRLGRAKSRARTLLALLRNYGTEIDPKRVIEPLEGILVLLDCVGDTELSESEGWLLMQCLKMVRDRSRKEPHVDSIEDGVSYSALYGEARLREVQS